MTDYTFRKATEFDLKAIKEIMEDAHDRLNNKSWYYIEGNNNFSWLHNHLENEGMTVVAEDDNHKIVGFLVVRYPRNDVDNLGLGKYENNDDLYGVAHMETTAVRVDHRGHQLMCRMINYAESLLDDSYIHLMATVHPDNFASLGSFIKCGYSIIKEQDNKYGEDLPRLILLKEVSIKEWHDLDENIDN